MDGDGERPSARSNPDLPPSFRRRRTSMAIPANLSLPTGPTTKPLHAFTFPNGSSAAATQPQPLDLGSLKAPSLAYTSLKDLLPAGAAAINSPTAAVSSCYEISIRNRLVKHAAWAYLQPMSYSPGTSSPSFLHRLWLRFCAPVSTCLCFINCHVIASIAAQLIWCSAPPDNIKRGFF